MDFIDRRHAMTLNGRLSVELMARRDQPPVENQIAARLDRLDGTERFALMLWALPADTDFDRVRLDKWPIHYIQAAGTRDRLMVEIRFANTDGDIQAVIGKTEAIDSEPDQIIEWDGIATSVFETEVFTAAEAVPLFLSYWQRGRVPDGYALRLIAVKPTSPPVDRPGSP